MDAILFVVLLPITLMMVALAFVILKGWGDGFIAGYNTVSNEEQKMYNIKRLRSVVAAMILFVMAFVWVAACLDDTTAILLGALPVLLIGLIAGIIIANTWCKK